MILPLRRFLLPLLLIACSAPASAFIKPTVRQTFGDHRYSGTYVAVDAGGDLHVKPSFSTYHSAVSSGTFYTPAVRAAYDTDEYGVGITGGWSPYTNNYKNRFGGGDVRWSWDFEDDDEDQPEPQAQTGTAEPPAPQPAVSVSTETVAIAASSEPLTSITVSTPALAAQAPAPFLKPAKKKALKGLSAIDVGATFLQTIHTQEITLPTRKAGTKIVPGTQNTVDVGQSDLGGNATVVWRSYSFSVDVTKSVYNKDLSKVAGLAGGVQRLSGLVSTIQGFPDLNASAKLAYDVAPWLSPYISYNYTTYRISQPFSVAYTVGIWAKLDRFRLDGSYERFAQSGSYDLDYITLSASAKFR